MNQAISHSATASSPAMPLAPPPSGPPIADLQDIILPNSISAYWLAPGWVLLFLLLMSLLAGLLLLWRRRNRKRQYQREAQSLLEQWLAQESENAPVTPNQLAELSSLLKRVVIHRTGRQQLAGLHGQHWADYLSAAAPGAFNSQTLDLITRGEYQATLASTVPRRELYRQCQLWLKTSKPLTPVSGGKHHAAV